MKGTDPDLKELRERIENGKVRCLEIDDHAGPGPFKITRYFFKDGEIESVVLSPNFKASCPSCTNSWTIEDIIERLRLMPVLAYELEMPGVSGTWIRVIPAQPDGAE
jgi:hypothetical protein